MKTARLIFAVSLMLPLSLLGAAEISLKSQKWLQCLAFSPDGKRVVAGNDEGRLWVVEAATGKSVVECKGVVSAPTAVAWSRDGRSFAVGGWNGVVTVREAKTGKMQARWRGHTKNILRLNQTWIFLVSEWLANQNAVSYFLT